MKAEKASYVEARTSALRHRRRILAARNTVEAKLDELLIAKEGGNKIAIAAKQKALADTITTIFGELSQQEHREFDFLLKKVYNNSRVEIDSALGRTFDTTNEYQLQGLLNREFMGMKYSDRIYRNNGAVAQRITTDLSRLLFQDASPTDIKLALAKDFNLSYTQADRLFRTEASRFFNDAAKDSYKAAGIVKVEWLTEQDDRTCEICGPRNGLVYAMGMEPIVPAHPSCRCTYLPVID